MRGLATAAVFIVIASCGASDSLGPFQPEVTNAQDNFQLQATGVTNVTTTKTYVWHNTGTAATVNHSTTTTAGSARITILAPGSVTVYDKALVASANESTTVGTSGDWTINLVLTNYSGTLNFRVQKK